MEIVHITFEKITGLKGTIEGDFHVTGLVDFRIPLIYLKVISGCEFLFRQGKDKVYLRPVDIESLGNYKEHFEHGVNFLIKEWSYGRGDGIKITNQNPN